MRSVLGLVQRRLTTPFAARATRVMRPTFEVQRRFCSVLTGDGIIRKDILIETYKDVGDEARKVMLETEARMRSEATRTTVPLHTPKSLTQIPSSRPMKKPPLVQMWRSVRPCTGTRWRVTWPSSSRPDRTQS